LADGESSEGSEANRTRLLATCGVTQADRANVAVGARVKFESNQASNRSNRGKIGRLVQSKNLGKGGFPRLSLSSVTLAVLSRIMSSRRLVVSTTIAMFAMVAMLGPTGAAMAMLAIVAMFYTGLRWFMPAMLPFNPQVVAVVEVEGEADGTMVFANIDDLVACCEVCTSAGSQVCPTCLAVRYCSRDCQRAHWRRVHNAECTHRNTT
jgi:hypothetical protein